MDRQSPDNDAIQSAQFRQIVSTAIADGIAEFFANQVDVTPPTAPAGLSGEARSQSQIDLGWTPATDDIGVLAYRIARDGVPIAETSRTRFTDTALNADTAYSYTVSARDFAGNWSAPSAPLLKSTTPATPYLGLWWNADESGWGMTLTQHRDTLFAAIFTYDAQGLPTWYVMSNCPLNAAACSGTLYRVNGGVRPTAAWTGTGLQVTPVGSGSLSFASANAATFSFDIDGVGGQKAIARQPIASGPPVGVPDFTDLWWNPNESGWGIAFTQESNILFAAWFTYDAAGKPIWYVAPNCPLSNATVAASCSGALYRVAGGSPLASVWSGQNRTVTPVGSLTVNFSDASNATIGFSIDGVAATRTIARQTF